MAIMLTGVSVAPSATAATVVGVLQAFDSSRTPMPAVFDLQTEDVGPFAIATDGVTLTAAAALAPGIYSIHVRAVGQGGFRQRGRFQIEVMAPPPAAV
jgi:hypothetical protein